MPGGCLEGVWRVSNEVKIGQFMSRSIQPVHVKDLSFENLASSSLEYGVVSIAQLVSSSVALLAKLVIMYFPKTYLLTPIIFSHSSSVPTYLTCK